MTDAPGVSKDDYISTGKNGFHTNTTAQLTYTSAGEEQEPKDYPNPVITVETTPVTLQVLKYKETTGDESYTEPGDVGGSGDQLIDGAEFVIGKSEVAQQGDSHSITGNDGNPVGIAVFDELERGCTYYLGEYSAADGYQTPGYTWKIDVAYDGSITVSRRDANGNSYNQLGPAEKIDDGVYRICIQNNEVISLPSTGSSGSILTSAAGVSIAALAVIALWHRSKRAM